MKYLILFVLCCNITFSQKITIINNDNHEVVQFVNIAFKNDSIFVKGCYSDENGVLEIKRNKVYNNIRFSCIGFDNKILRNKIFNDTVIRLIPKEILLNEVIVTNKSKKNYLIPNIVKSKKFFALDYGGEFALLLNNIFEKEVKIEKLRLNIYKLKNNIKIRIKFYKYNNNFDSKADLIDYNNIIKEISAQKGGYVYIDLSDYNIVLPTAGALISIEGIEGIESLDGNVYVNKNFNFKLKTLKYYGISFFRKNHIRNNKWMDVNKSHIENYKLTFNREINRDWLFIPDINVEVSEF